VKITEEFYAEIGDIPQVFTVASLESPELAGEAAGQPEGLRSASSRGGFCVKTQ
jgi:hypothetical protein